MGSWTSFQIDGYQLSTSKSYSDNATLSLFTEAHKQLRLWAVHHDRRWVSSWLSAAEAAAAIDLSIDLGAEEQFVVTLPVGATWERVEDDDDDAGDDDAAHAALESPVALEALRYDGVAAHAYVAPAAHVRDRLDAMGFTRAAAERVLAECAAAELDGAEAQLAEGDNPYSFAARDREALTGLSFERWLDAFRWIKTRGAYEVDEYGHHADARFRHRYVQASEATPLVRYLLDRNNYEVPYGFPGDEVRHLYRAALEACEPDAEVRLDLTDVTDAGYYEPWQPVAEEARVAHLARYPADAPTIVLTEGVSDQRALQAALRLIHPHLADVYTFLDFEAMKVRGGAPAAVAMLKAFAAAGVANRVVALLDNDTAAHAALRELQGVELPSHMRVLTYPPLPLATAYPSIGPHGVQLADVNGAAAGLELYFGEDVLRDPGDELTPVQWGSFDHTLRRYQGELRDKARLQERFTAKLAAAEADPALLATQDWSGMRAILDVLRGAFHERPLDD